MKTKIQVHRKPDPPPESEAPPKKKATKKKRPGAGKGGAYEREIARVLTQWISGQRRPELFWRSAGSGSSATQAVKHGKKSKMPGDLMAIDEAGLFLTEIFFLEAKDRKRVTTDIKHILDRNSTMFTWWDKACQEAKDHNLEPLMFFKTTFSPHYIMYGPTTAGRLRLYTNRYTMSFSTPTNRIVVGNTTICLLNDFLQCIDPAKLREIKEEWLEK